MHRIEAIKGDIVKLKVDAIVNAANNSLLGGGGVDGAIHEAAGPYLLEACRKLKGCATGDAKITEGFKLPARYIIHTVGPVWSGGTKKEPQLLSQCYRRSMELAVEYGLKTIAFPSISTGAYRFPFDLASTIAVKTVYEFVVNNQIPEKVIFVCFSQNDFLIYSEKINEIFSA